MKATINGITVEGTPQEIAAYTKLLTKRAEGTSLACESVRAPDLGISKLRESLKGMAEKSNNLHALYASGSLGVTIKPEKCLAAMNGGCYCTGECMK